MPVARGVDPGNETEANLFIYIYLYSMNIYVYINYLYNPLISVNYKANKYKTLYTFQ